MRHINTLLLAILLALAILALLLAGGCATIPTPTAGLAVQAGPCGLEYVATAAAGVPLSVPVGGWVVRVEALGDATVTLAQACHEPASAPQRADKETPQ